MTELTDQQPGRPGRVRPRRARRRRHRPWCWWPAAGSLRGAPVITSHGRAGRRGGDHRPRARPARARGERRADGLARPRPGVEALRAVIEAAGGHAVLCGHSSGCSISLYAAAQGLPVDGLVLWEAPVAAPAQPTADWVDGFERRIDAGELEAAQEWYMKDMPPEWLAGAKASPGLAGDLRAASSALRADGQSLRWATASWSPARCGTRCGVPVLAVYGSSTFPGMVDAADADAVGAPQTEVLEVAGAHHEWDPAASRRCWPRSSGPAPRPRWTTPTRLGVLYPAVAEAARRGRGDAPSGWSPWVGRRPTTGPCRARPCVDQHRADLGRCRPARCRTSCSARPSRPGRLDVPARGRSARVPAGALPVVTTAWVLSGVTLEARLRFLQRLDAAAHHAAGGLGVGGGGRRRARRCRRWATGRPPATASSASRCWTHRSLHAEAVGRCWSRGRYLAWLAGDEGRTGLSAASRRRAR